MKKILAIDDSDRNLATIKAVFDYSLNNYNVLFARSGIEGLEIAIKELPDTILLDIQMPDIDGYETCSRLKSNELTKHIPVIMITAYSSDKESRIRAFNIGADVFLTKPIDPTMLITQVQVMLRIKDAEDQLRNRNEVLEELVETKTIELSKKNKNLQLEISEHKNTNESLKETKDQYKLLFNHIADPIVVFDQKSLRFIDCNIAMIEKYGYTREELSNMTPLDLHMQSEDTDKVKLNINDKEEDSPNEYQHIGKDGSIFYVETHTQTINYQGKEAWITSIRDISDSKKAVEVIRESEERFRSLYENSTIGLYRSTPDGKIILANPTLIKLLGYTSYDEFAVRNIIKDFYKNPSDRKKFINTIEENKKVIGHESIWITKGGTTICVRESASTTSDSKGKTLYYDGTVEDITDRVEAERELKNTTELLQNVMDAATDEAIITTDERGTILSWNEGAIRLLGYEPDEVIGKKTSKYFQNKEYLESGEMDENIKVMISTGKPITLEVDYITKLGKTIPVQTIVSPRFDEYGKFIGMVGMARDITKRKIREEELKKAIAKATESDRLKTAFLANMSHELRTPLNSIIGLSDLIDGNLSKKEILSFIEIINESGNQLLSIIESLFDIALIEAGQIELKKENIKLDSVLNEIHEIIEQEQLKTNKNHLDIELVIPPETKDLTIKTDVSKLKQILINLLKNALKFTHHGYVHYGYKIETKSDKQSLIFFVEDTGIGISKCKWELIFEAFKQVEESNTKNFGGSGIGLSISQKLIELLGGDIWLESELGKGSIFYFAMPFEKGEVNTKTRKVIKQNEKQNTNEKKTILIVEDDKSSYDLFKLIFQNTKWLHCGQKMVSWLLNYVMRIQILI